jgi:cephalosporin-C deacetylase-like acetyl esterase
MDCIRAVDFLFEQEEVDKKRVAVEGGSQGGALSFATAALDNERIMACAPDVPFLSDFKDYFAIAPWPGGEAFKYLKDHPDFSEAEMYETLSYIDIKNLAQDIKAPVFMGFGMRDMVCPPHINFAAYNEVRSPKSYVAYPNAGHGLPGEHYTAKMQWLKKHFGLK